ncbi:hypothetical protein GCM10023174_27020 [Chelativorans composti]|jgi:hypothetical protein
MLRGERRGVSRGAAFSGGSALEIPATIRQYVRRRGPAACVRGRGIADDAVTGRPETRKQMHLGGKTVAWA